MEKKLTEKNTSNKVIYTFYKDTKEREWAKEMRQNNKDIYFIENQKPEGFRALSKIIKSNGVNVLHLHFNLPATMLLLLRLVFPKIKIIVHFHNTISRTSVTYIRNIKRNIKIFLYNKVINTFCGCSEAVFNSIIKYGLNSNKCCYIDNGVDFSRLDIDCGDLNEIFNIKGKKIIMIYGTHFYRKGVDIAINAVKDIVDKYNIILMIVCQNREFVLGEIKKIAGCIPEWIIIAPSQENIAAYYKMSSIYITPSREEGFSYTMLESIYCGTPVIRSDLAAMDRKIPDEIIVPVDDISALQQSIEFVLKLDDKSKQNILAEQKKYIVQRWNIDIWSNKIISMYTKVKNREHFT
jgi:glycosyltransferase involved in cell wall biosynthesis